mgnify:CR=1 FL=1
MLKKIIFEIETITPMFLAGADQSKAELRAASIKGLLRFWWRALQAESDLNILRERESQIFGSSDDKLGGGSSFSMRITYEGTVKTSKENLPKQNISVTSKGRTFPVNILEYLAYGTCEYNREVKKNVMTRDYIMPRQKFNILLHIKEEKYTSELLKSLFVFNLFGGIGSRSRNGFGSFAIANNKEAFEFIEADLSIPQPYSSDNLKKLINQVDTSSYSSFSKETKVYKTKTTYDTWDKALGEIGKIYRGIRSGDIKKDNQPFENKHSYEKRQYIGSPIIADKQEKSFLERHTKPYFIKIANEGNKYRSYILYLPSQYCTGLSEDRNRKHINHSAVDRNFTEVCNEFNTFLSQHMETIL